MTCIRTIACASVAVGLFTMNVASGAAQDQDAARRVTRYFGANLDHLAAELAALQARGGRTGGPAAPAGLGTDPMTGPIVTGSPFSADATTTVVQTLGDGTRIEQRATAKFYRDGTGRVRREMTVIGLDALNPSTEPRTVITFDSVPGDSLPYSLDAVRRTAARLPRNAFRYCRQLECWRDSFEYAGRAGILCRRSEPHRPSSGPTICWRRRSN